MRGLALTLGGFLVACGPPAASPPPAPAATATPSSQAPSPAPPRRAATTEVIELPLRVHLIAADTPSLDAASVLDEAGVRRYVDAANVVFEAAGVRWRIESVRRPRARDEDAFKRAVEAKKRGAQPLVDNVNEGDLLAPKGWDMFVVRETSAVGFGGAFRCSLDRAGGPGAVFVPVHSRKGKPQPTRKWTHELGHAMGLRHTPCTDRYAGNLMMSGKCKRAERGRVGLTARQIARIKRQRDRGRPATCPELRLTSPHGARDPRTAPDRAVAAHAPPARSW